MNRMGSNVPPARDNESECLGVKSSDKDVIATATTVYRAD